MRELLNLLFKEISPTTQMGITISLKGLVYIGAIVVTFWIYTIRQDQKALLIQQQSLITQQQLFGIEINALMTANTLNTAEHSGYDTKFSTIEQDVAEINGRLGLKASYLK